MSSSQSSVTVSDRAEAAAPPDANSAGEVRPGEVDTEAASVGVPAEEEEASAHGDSETKAEEKEVEVEVEAEEEMELIEVMGTRARVRCEPPLKDIEELLIATVGC